MFLVFRCSLNNSTFCPVVYIMGWGCVFLLNPVVKKELMRRKKQCELQSAGPHPLGLHHKSRDCTSGHDGAAIILPEGIPFLNSFSENYDIIVTELLMRFGCHRLFTGGLVWFGLHSSLIGFGFDRFLQLNFVLCLNISDVPQLLRGNNAHLIILVS